MTCMSKIVAADGDFQETCDRAQARAAVSYFDQHIIRTDDGRFWAVDEGDYETVIADMMDQIIATVRAGRLDDG